MTDQLKVALWPETIEGAELVKLTITGSGGLTVTVTVLLTEPVSLVAVRV